MWAKHDTPADQPTWQSFAYSATVFVLTPLYLFKGLFRHVSFYPLIALNRWSVYVWIFGTGVRV